MSNDSLKKESLNHCKTCSWYIFNTYREIHGCVSDHIYRYRYNIPKNKELETRHFIDSDVDLSDKLIRYCKIKGFRNV